MKIFPGLLILIILLPFIELRLSGGTSDEHEADDKIQSIIDNLSDNIREKTGKSYSNLQAISYKTQVVAGTNYFIKVKAEDDYLHVRVYQPLPYTQKGPEINSIQENKSKDDIIEYF